MYLNKTAIKKLTDWHMSQVGYLEKKNGNLQYLYDKIANAGSANYTKYGYEMHILQPSNMDYPAAWCDAYFDNGLVNVFGAETAKKLVHSFDDYTVQSAQHYKNHGEWHSVPQEGDQIFFKDVNGGICHTGYVYDVSSTHVFTIEGNTSNANGVVANGGGVAKKCYSLGYSRIAGYGRPNYDIIESEDEPMTTDEKTKFNLLVDTVSELTARVDKIAKAQAAQGTSGTFVYNYNDSNVPEWAKESLSWAMRNKVVEGTGEGLNLGSLKLWVLVVVHRTAKVIAKLVNVKI